MWVTTVADLDPVALLTIKRAGFFIIKRTKLGYRIGGGIDEKSGEATDFAGSMIPKDKTIIHTAIRELQEESLGIFGRINWDILNKSTVIYNEEELIIFYPMDFNEAQLRRQFGQKVRPGNEMKDLFFYSVEEFIDCLAESSNGPRFYSRVRKLIVDAIINNGWFLE